MFDQYVNYTTAHGQCVCGDSLELLQQLDDNSVDLVVTSPPFALQRKKSYGNEDQEEYVNWLCRFGRLVYQKLADSGSFVLDIGGAYEKGQPTYSLYQFRTLIKLCDEIGFHLAQPFYWHNPSSLPAPIEWVNKRKIRAKTSVDTVWWLCKTPFCHADVTKVLTPYSERMQHLLASPDDFIRGSTAARPSGHIVNKKSWGKDNGGAIPPNLLQIPNSDSNGQYLRYCKVLSLKGHPARFPSALPEFFIKMLTSENDLVVDIFGGSNTTGQVAESLRRNWLSFELSQEYVATSSFRFSDSIETARSNYNRLMSGQSIQL